MRGMRILFLCLVVSIATLPLLANEGSYQHDLCLGMHQEVTLSNGSRADCVSETHVIEVEFSENWAKALGRALSYAVPTGLKPGIFLICRETQLKCFNHQFRLEEAILTSGLSVDVWAAEASN